MLNSAPMLNLGQRVRWGWVRRSGLILIGGLDAPVIAIAVMHSLTPLLLTLE